MITGAFFEPKALCGSTSVMPAADCGAALAISTETLTSRVRPIVPNSARLRITQSSSIPCKYLTPKSRPDYHRLAVEWLATTEDFPQLPRGAAEAAYYHC